MRLTPDQKKFIRSKHGGMSVKEMAGHLGVEPKDVRRGMAELGLVSRDVAKREREESRAAARKHVWRRMSQLVIWLKKPRVTFWTVVLLAALARLLHWWTVADHALFAAGGDLWWAGQAGRLHRVALEISGGDWLLRGQPVFWDMPIQAYFLAVLHLLGAGSAAAVGLIQALLSALTAGLIALLARRLFGPVTGLASGLLASIYGLFLLDASWTGGNSLLLLLAVAGLWSLAATLQGPRWWKWLLTGLLLGLGMLCRAALTLFFPLALLAVIIWFGPGRIRRWGPALALIVLSAAAPVVGVGLHNGLIGGDWTVFETSLGPSLYAHNGPSADASGRAETRLGDHRLGHGLRSGPAVFTSLARARRGGRAMLPSQMSAFFRAETWAAVAADPARWTSLWLGRISLFFNAHEGAAERSPAFWRARAPLLQGPCLTWGVILPLGFIGLLLSLRGFRKRALLVFFFLACLIDASLFGADSHRRLLAAPVLLVYAAALLRWLWVKANRRQWLPLGLALLALIGFYLFVYRAAPAADARFDELLMAQALQRDGRTAEADQHLDVALACGEDFFLARLIQGRLLLDRPGQERRARDLLLTLRRQASAARDEWIVRQIDGLIRRPPAAKRARAAERE